MKNGIINIENVKTAIDNTSVLDMLENSPWKALRKYLRLVVLGDNPLAEEDEIFCRAVEETQFMLDLKYGELKWQTHYIGDYNTISRHGWDHRSVTFTLPTIYQSFKVPATKNLYVRREDLKNSWEEVLKVLQSEMWEEMFREFVSDILSD